MCNVKSILVIGSNSFSGAGFSAHCLKNGWTVWGVSRSLEPHECYLPYKWLGSEHKSNFSFYQFNIKQDARAIAALAEKEKVPFVVNFAALGMVAESWQYPVDYYQTNLVGNVALHEELRKVACLKKYVHVSTPEVYGHTEGLVDESAPLNPSTPYAASRAACDLHLKTFHHEYNFPVVWTRSANIFGPGQQVFRIVPRVVLCHLLGEKLQLQGGGASVRSFIYSDDVSRATLSIATDAEPGACYHISTKRFLSVRELAEIVSQRMGRSLQDIAEIVPDRPGKDLAYTLDATALATNLSWKEEIGLEDGIDDTIAWARKWIGALRQLPRHYQHKP